MKEESDWKPLRSSKAYRDHWEATFEGTNSRYRLVKREEVPFCFHCGWECERVKIKTLNGYRDSVYKAVLYHCPRCNRTREDRDGSIVWKPKPNDQT